MARQCLMIQNQQSVGRLTSEQIDPCDLTEGKGAPVERTISAPLVRNDPTKTVQIGSSLNEDQRQELIDLLQKNADIFAWTAIDMLGIPSKVIMHELKVDPLSWPIHQKKRNFALQRQKVINEEVAKLLDVGFIREVHYPDWLADGGQMDGSLVSLEVT